MEKEDNLIIVLRVSVVNLALEILHCHKKNYPNPCFASLSRKVEGAMPRAAAAAVLFPPELRRASCRSCFSAWSMAAWNPPTGRRWLKSNPPTSVVKIWVAIYPEPIKYARSKVLYNSRTLPGQSWRES